MFCFNLFYTEYEYGMHPDIPTRSKRGRTPSVRISDEYHDETSSVYWEARAQHTVHKHLARELNTNRAKNIIFFLGDGMSVPTIAAARMYMGQKRGHSGEQSRLSFETFPYVGLSKVN